MRQTPPSSSRNLLKRAQEFQQPLERKQGAGQARFRAVDLSGRIGTAQLNAVVALGGGSRIVAAGNDGVIAEWNGNSFADALNPSNWTAPKSSTDRHIFSLSFDAVNHGFVIGQSGVVLEYD